MSNIFNIIKDEDRITILKNLSIILNEKEDNINKILPVWNSIVLASLLKLTRNRMQFSALQNFIRNHNLPIQELELLKNNNNNTVSFSPEKLINYGESLMGVLMPDKKSAIANALSQNLNCRSSFILRGLSIIFTLYGEFLKNETVQILSNWKGYAEYFSPYKQSIFWENIPERVQKSISEILLLSDIFKESSSSILQLSDESEISISDDEKDKHFLLSPVVITSFVLFILLSGAIYFYLNNKNEDVENIGSDTEEIIPLDSLNKLNDSLTKAVIDSNRIKNDSLVTLIWHNGKEFQVPTNSAIVKIHSYLIDSTQTEPLQVFCTEISFNDETDQLNKTPEYFYKRLVEGLNAYKKTKLKLYAFSSEGNISATRRGFFLKNRLVGEGLSPKRVEVNTKANSLKSDTDYPLNGQVVLEFQK